ncbi:MAG: PGPGW domain-containing protein [Nocardioides sp.]
MRAVRRVFLEVFGWALVVGGIAALVLPGPGLLALFAGLVLLSQQYTWAERRVEPVKERAVKAAADGVQTWPRILLSTFGVLWLIGAGILWGIRPAAPGWWPVGDRWWLAGGWATGVTLIVSGLLAGAMMVYAYVTYRRPR